MVKGALDDYMEPRRFFEVLGWFPSTDWAKNRDSSRSRRALSGTRP